MDVIYNIIIIILNRLSRCSSDWSYSHYVTQAELEIMTILPPASATPVLRLQAHITMPDIINVIEGWLLVV